MKCDEPRHDSDGVMSYIGWLQMSDAPLTLPFQILHVYCTINATASSVFEHTCNQRMMLPGSLYIPKV